MLTAFLWYLVALGVGWVSVPLLFRLLPTLADRGYSFSRIFGLLAWGYLYWILGRLGFSLNSLGGLLFCLAVLVGLAVFSLRRGRAAQLGSWLQENLRLILMVEALFLVAFAGWALVRSLNPEIVGTEKPMELAFINAILRSKTFPPHDPWLSGYAISYYYLGFILVAMLAKLTGTIGSVAFNLGISLTFALSAVGAFGVVYNLLAARKKRARSPLFPALLGPFFTLIVSNWEGFLHYLHAQGIFWRRNAQGELVSWFWRWMDIQNLVNPPQGSSFGHWWWWRASRVIKDYDLSGYGRELGREVISEFPFFSYLLADLHPHVLAMPFVFLILGFGLELFLKQREGSFRIPRMGRIHLSPITFLTAAWLAGSMAFLNTWNFPMYVALLAGTYALRLRREFGDRSLGITLLDFLGMGALLGLVGGLLFLPFYIGFDSQAGGIIPNLVYVTAGRQFWVMFGPLLVPLLGYLGIRLWERRAAARLGQAAGLTVGLLLLLLGLLLIMIALMPLLPISIGPWIVGEGFNLSYYLSLIAGSSLGEAVTTGLFRRVLHPGTWLTLALVSLLSLALLLPRRRAEQEPSAGEKADQFSLILVFSGMVLVLVPEFVYLRDLFGYRINTVFKFYYQTWLIWSVAAAYGTVIIFQKLRPPVRFLLQVLVLISLAMALFYPVLSLPDKTNNFQREGGLTLDGGAFFNDFYSADAQAARWLREQPFGVIAEAVGGSYSTAHARMSTYTGFPTVLGWDFHEVQWRGGSELVDPRRNDIAELYCTHSWQTAMSVLDRYQIRYLVVGEVERSTYSPGSQTCPNGLNAEKFSELMEVLFQNQGVTIYGYQPAELRNQDVPVRSE